ncbi:MAG TPA: MaoC family dehydratase [Bradyrhizobium sp.]|nr:MaoC family dehydratase [Bradyrhizobium sp.]
MPLNPLFLDDLQLGMTWIGQSVTITADAIIAFGKEYDPQPFHTDPVTASTGLFGGLIASSWHVAALVMRQFIDARPFGSAPILGLGVNELRWLRPVRPEDVLTARGEIIDLKPSKSKPGRGVVRTAIAVTNQAGVTVMSFLTSTHLSVRA